MVVADFNVVCATVFPDEADSVLIIDADAVLTFTVTDQLLQTVTRRDAQVVNVGGGINEQQFLVGGSRQIRPDALDEVPIPHLAGIAVFERSDHATNTNAWQYYCPTRLARGARRPSARH